MKEHRFLPRLYTCSICAVRQELFKSVCVRIINKNRPRDQNRASAPVIKTIACLLMNKKHFVDQEMICNENKAPPLLGCKPVKLPRLSISCFVRLH